MTENEIKNAIEIFEKPSKHIKCVHKCENGMDFLTYSQYLVAAFETAIEGLKELEKYRAIGTVEECREARERQVPTKPKGRYKTRYMWDAAYCPVCECGITARWNFCQNCGKSIDWSE